MRPLIHIFIAASFLFLFACGGVKYSFKGISIPPEAKTISVIYFQNNATMANPVEAQKFTERLRDMVSSQTSLALTKQNGDLQFEGYIADYSVAPVAIQSTDQAALNRLTVTIHVKYSSKLEPAKNFEQTFQRFYDYSTERTLTEIEGTALDEINRQICEDVFQRAFNNW